MYQPISIRHPEYLTITGPEGTQYRGADQDWFPDLWQQRAGCGPTAAALMIAYLAAAHPQHRALYPEGAMDQASFTKLMCRVWDYVTPGHHGLNQPDRFAQGLADYGASVGLDLRPQVLALPAARTKRPSFSAYAGFLCRCLAQDCPVAFLNLHNGKEARLDYWHWVTILSLDGPKAVILDSGREFTIDLALWHATTRRRGGFVGFPRGGEE